MAAREEAGVIPRISSPPPGYPVQLCFSLFHIMILWSLYLRWSLKLKIPWHKCRCIPVLTLTKLTQRGFVSLFIYFPNSDGAFARLEVSLNSRTVNFILRQAWLFIWVVCLFIFCLIQVLVMWPRLVSNLQSSCLLLTGIEIISMCYLTQSLWLANNVPCTDLSVAVSLYPCLTSIY